MGMKRVLSNPLLLLALVSAATPAIAQMLEGPPGNPTYE